MRSSNEPLHFYTKPPCEIKLASLRLSSLACALVAFVHLSLRSFSFLHIPFPSDFDLTLVFLSLFLPLSPLFLPLCLLHSQILSTLSSMSLLVAPGFSLDLWSFYRTRTIAGIDLPFSIYGHPMGGRIQDEEVLDTRVETEAARTISSAGWQIRSISREMRHRHAFISQALGETRCRISRGSSREKLPMDASSKDSPSHSPLIRSTLLVSQAPAIPPRYRRHFRRQPLESGILMLYGNARRHRHIGEEMETRKHSSSLLRIQAYASSDLRNYFPSPYYTFRIAIWAYPRYTSLS